MSKIALEPNAAGTGTFSIASPATNTNRTLTLPDETGTVLTSVSAIPAAQITGLTSTNPLTLGTAVASTSGTAIDLTGIPSWAKRVTLMFNGVSFASNPARVKVILGTSAGFETTGYISSAMTTTGVSISQGSYTDGIHLGSNFSYTAGTDYSGQIVFSNLTGNTWTAHGATALSGDYSHFDVCSGTKTLSGTLNSIRITTTLLATFDAGTINISYEG